jgi:NTE family protein
MPNGNQLVPPEFPIIADTEAERLEDKIALCLSGGGYRAMLFHVGVLWCLEHAGYLRKLARFSSVSGGSITAGVLALAWNGLEAAPDR